VDRSYEIPPTLPCKASLLRRGFEPTKDGDQTLVSTRVAL
jgi:hypothetical protein